MPRGVEEAVEGSVEEAVEGSVERGVEEGVEGAVAIELRRCRSGRIYKFTERDYGTGLQNGITDRDYGTGLRNGDAERCCGTGYEMRFRELAEGARGRKGRESKSDDSTTFPSRWAVPYSRSVGRRKFTSTQHPPQVDHRGALHLPKPPCFPGTSTAPLDLDTR